MKLVRTGDEAYVFDATPEAEACLAKLPSWRKARLGHTRQWSEKKDGYWRVSLAALADVKALA